MSSLKKFFIGCILGLLVLVGIVIIINVIMRLSCIHWSIIILLLDYC